MDKQIVEITYKNEAGLPCKAVITDPGKIHHTWYSAKRNCLGKFDKTPVTVFKAFLDKLKGCTEINIQFKPA